MIKAMGRKGLCPLWWFQALMGHLLQPPCLHAGQQIMTNEMAMLKYPEQLAIHSCQSASPRAILPPAFPTGTTADAFVSKPVWFCYLQERPCRCLCCLWASWNCKGVSAMLCVTLGEWLRLDRGSPCWSTRSHLSPCSCWLVENDLTQFGSRNISETL